jgi:hypothetical protein
MSHWFGKKSWQGIWPIDQAAASVGIIKQERAPGCGGLWTPVRMLRVEITRHQDVENSAQTLGQARLDQGFVDDR